MDRLIIKIRYRHGNGGVLASFFSGPENGQHTGNGIVFFSKEAWNIFVVSIDDPSGRIVFEEEDDSLRTG